jgi:DNA-directed RNA polymerase subunit RPC12/RpoP
MSISEKDISEHRYRVVGESAKYREFSDGSMGVECQQCGKKETLTADTVRNKKNIGINFSQYVCYDCWKANEDSKKRIEVNRGQAVNLAVQAAVKFASTEEEFANLVGEYYITFLKFLDERQNGKN